MESIPYRVLMMALFANFQCTDSILPRLIGPLSTAASSSTMMAAYKDETGSDGQGERKNSTLSSKHEAYHHFTPKEQAQIENRLVTSDSTV